MAQNADPSEPPRKSQKSSAPKYLLAIVACQGITFWAWMAVGPQRLTSFDSVRTLLDLIAAETPQHPASLLAANAILKSAQRTDIFSIILLIVSLTVTFLSLLAWFALWKPASRDLEVSAHKGRTPS